MRGGGAFDDFRSNKELGIPDKPYTVESPLTMGIRQLKLKCKALLVR
jgi:hypothetical protein